MPRPPFLVQVLFHPESKGALELARRIHRELNDDSLVPGLRVPTRFGGYTETSVPASGGSRRQPPAAPTWDDAERCFVVVLADNQLNDDEAWCGFVADVWLACRASGGKHRCVPVQLDADAWPLDQRLNRVNFVRGIGQRDAATRDAFVVRRLLIEMCRHLGGLEPGDPDGRAPVSLFLSHAKADLGCEPKAAEAMVQYLKADQPVEAWVDSGDIGAGSEFSDAIGKGVQRTTVLVILTDRYATREWCRREVLLAKQHQRPVVVVDALARHEVRSFPYLGNLPVMRWDGDPARALDLVLKETLHHLHVREVLRGTAAAADTILVRPPELLNLVGLEPGASVLYPDPPVGDEESALLAKLHVPFATPLQRLGAPKDFGKLRLALSMSESADAAKFGWDAAHFEAAMIEISRYLLIRGATLAYGGHLGPEGYTQRLIELVRSHNALSGLPPFERVVNHLGWPIPRPGLTERAQLKWASKVEPLPRPADVDAALDPAFVDEPAYFSAEVSPKHRFAWARGMTEMRRHQADRSRSGVAARIVLGGVFGETPKLQRDGTWKPSWYQGRIPGVLEEVLLSVEAGQPVFLIGTFGGASKLVIDLLRGIDRPEATWDYQKKAPHAAEMRALYEARGVPWIDYPAIVATLRAKGLGGINPYLTPAEHEALCDATDVGRTVELLWTGLERLAAGTPAS